MTLKTFDNNGGAGDGMWDVAVNWDPEAVPVNGDYMTIAANCTCDSDESAAILSGGASTINNGKTLSIAAGGHVKVQDQNLSLSTTGTLEMDGGTFTLLGTGAAIQIYGGTITGTANGGIINLVGANGIAKIQETNIPADAASRLLIDGSSGAGYAHIYHDGNPRRYQNAIFNDVYMWGAASGIVELTGVIWKNCSHPWHTLQLPGVSVVGKDSYIYGNTGRGIWAGYLDLDNFVFGQTEVGGSSPNAIADIYAGTSGAFGRLRNCILASSTEIDVQSTGGHVDLSSTSHDQDPDYHCHWFGRWHKADTVFGASAQGGSGTAWRIVSSSVCAADVASRCRREICTIPADDGDKLDVTLYLKGTNTKTATLWIDPEGLYGTAQSYAETADGNWNQRTLPQYTVATGGGEKVRVPVYLDITGASETWFYDTLAWEVS